MFHKIKNVNILSEYVLTIQFAEGVTKTYDMTKLIQENSLFKELKNQQLFHDVKVDVGGYEIIWNDDIDISCDELFANGNKIITPFDGLMAFSDATDIWGLNESTLRKAIAYGKLVNGIDVCKYGKQWVIALSAMEREYGTPKR